MARHGWRVTAERTAWVRPKRRPLRPRCGRSRTAERRAADERLRAVPRAHGVAGALRAPPSQTRPRLAHSLQRHARASRFGHAPVRRAGLAPRPGREYIRAAAITRLQSRTFVQ